MSEWIDFLVYAIEAWALWVLMPRWGVRMALPMLRDRNSAWVDAHPNVLASAKPGSWFLKACYAWGVFTVLALLATRLGLKPQHLLPGSDATLWKDLMSTNSLLVALGLVAYFSGGAVFMRWVAKTVPPSQRRQATLRPRVADDYVPRWLRRLVYGAIGVHLLAWLYAGFSRHRDPPFWWVFAAIMGMTAVVLVLGQLSVLRRPGWMDRVNGDYFRSVEIRLMFALQFCFVAFGAVALSKLLLDLDLSRACALGFALFVAAVFLVLTRPPARNGAGGTAQGTLAVR